MEKTAFFLFIYFFFLLLNDELNSEHCRLHTFRYLYKPNKCEGKENKTLQFVIQERNSYSLLLHK